MELVSEDSVGRYLAHDVIGALIEKTHDSRLDELTCQKWLRQSAPKRLIFERLYGDLLFTTKGLRVLDIGGGVTCLSRILSERHDYNLVDLMVHAGDGEVEQALEATRKIAVHVMDWYDYIPVGGYDVIIANDLLPNVDQRLDLFLQRFLRAAREVRLSLTFYPDLRFYKTRRENAEEILYMLAWDGEVTARVLEKYAEYIIEPDFGLFAENNASVFPNGRQVCLVRLRGGLN
jgi:hypothetical protein